MDRRSFHRSLLGLLVAPFAAAAARAQDRTHRIRCVVVGDHGVGKTSLILRATTGSMPSPPPDLAASPQSISLLVRRSPVTVEVIDTQGEEDYDRLRRVSYRGANVVLVCVSIANSSSLVSVIGKWYPEVRHHLPSAPVVLVGCKADLQGQPDSVSSTELQELDRAVGAVQVVQCSALTGASVREVFAVAARAGTTPSP